MRTKSILPALALALACAGPLAAPLAAEALDLPRARELALARSRSLRKALLEVDSAGLALKARSYETRPSLSASAQAGLSYSSEASLLSSFRASLGLSASQPIYDGGRNAALAAIDAIGDSIARSQARSAYFAAVKGLEQSYYAALEARAAEAAARSALEAARLRLELALAKLEAGMIARPAYLKAESEAASLESALGQARNASAAAALKLSSLTGLPPSTELAEEAEAEVEALAARLASLSEVGAEAFADALDAAARAGSPEAESWALAAAKAQGEVEYAKKAGKPAVSASWSHNLSYSGASGLDLLGGSLSISASLSLDSRRIKNAIAMKEIAAAEAALDGEESLSSLGLELRSAAFSAIAEARAIASSRKALEYARRSYESQLEAFRLSSLSASELSDAEALVGSALASLISARYGFLSGLSSIRALAGLEDESLLEAAIP